MPTFLKLDGAEDVHLSVYTSAPAGDGVGVSPSLVPHSVIRGLRILVALQDQLNWHSLSDPFQSPES